MADQIMDNLKLALSMIYFLEEKNDISRSVDYQKFMDTKYNFGSLGNKIQAAEYARLDYEARRREIIAGIQEITDGAL